MATFDSFLARVQGMAFDDQKTSVLTTAASSGQIPYMVRRCNVAPL